jgi:hypothetical protein
VAQNGSENIDVKQNGLEDDKINKEIEEVIEPFLKKKRGKKK